MEVNRVGATLPLMPAVFMACMIFQSAAWGLYPVALSTTPAQMKAFVGSSEAKLVFVNVSENVKTLQYIDFSEVTLKVRTIAAAVNPTAPALSPDGNWVAFASAPGMNGEAGTNPSIASAIYICRLAEDAEPVRLYAGNGYEPRFLPDADSLEVIFPTAAPNYAWMAAGKTLIVDIAIRNGAPLPGQPRVLWEHGAFTAGLSRDGRYLAGGGGLTAMLDLKSAAPKTDTTTSPYSAQACNASISSSWRFPNTMMYLDFGLRSGMSAPEINEGQKWTMWQVIFIVDATRSIRRHYIHPRRFETPLETAPPSLSQGSLKWHHPEWSNHPLFAVATLNVGRFFSNGQDGYLGGGTKDYQERVYAINLKDSAYLEILRPGHIAYAERNNGIFWPGLWVQIPQAFEEDPRWLESPAGSLRVGASGQYGGMLINRNRGRIRSESPFQAVEYFDLSGKTLGTGKPSGNRQRVALPRRTVTPAGRSGERHGSE